jgi:hypothetical protein
MNTWKWLIAASIFACLFAGATISVPAQQSLFSRPPDTRDLGQGLGSDRDVDIVPGVRQQGASDFTLPNPSRISDVHWYGFYSGTFTPPPGSVQFRVRIFDDAGGAPVAIPLYDSLTTASLAPLAIVQNQQTYVFRSPLPVSFTADAGRRYWLSVLEIDPNTGRPFSWFLSSLTAPIGFASRNNEGADWVVVENAPVLSFALFGSVVPEPSTFVLAGIGIVAMLSTTLVKKARNRSVRN